MSEIRFPKTVSTKQKKAIKYLAETNLSKAEISERIGVSIGSLNLWEKKSYFREALDAAINLIENVDSEFRRKSIQKLLPAVYEELHKRAIEGDLEGIETKKLVDIATKLQHEQRLDTPGDFTSKSATGNLPALGERYQRSLSGKLHKNNKLEAPKRKKIVHSAEARDE
jgi:hypothetical protein